MIGLSLEGGGAKGSYQAGAYLALKRCHIKIDAVVGTSIGSLNAALIAQGDYKKMISLWKDVSMNELIGVDEEEAFKLINKPLNFKTIKKTFKDVYKIFKEGGLDISPYRALIRNNVNEEKVRSSKMIYGLTTLKIDSLKPLELYIDDIPKNQLHDYIVASSYLPIFKNQKMIDNSYYIDGGVYNNSPTDMLEKIGCTTIYNINIRGIGVKKPRFKKKANIIEIKPKNNLGSIVIFNKESIENNMKRGYYDTLKVLEKIDGKDYYFYKKNDSFYSSITKKWRDKTKDEIKSIFKVKTDKQALICALEYFLEKEGMSDLTLYKVKYVIKKVKQTKKEDKIYNCIKML